MTSIPQDQIWERSLVRSQNTVLGEHGERVYPARQSTVEWRVQECRPYVCMYVCVCTPDPCPPRCPLVSPLQHNIQRHTHTHAIQTQVLAKCVNVICGMCACVCAFHCSEVSAWADWLQSLCPRVLLAGKVEAFLRTAHFVKSTFKSGGIQRYQYIPIHQFIMPLPLLFDEIPG